MEKLIISMMLLGFHLFTIKPREKEIISQSLLPSVRFLSQTQNLIKEEKKFCLQTSKGSLEEVYYLYDSNSKYAGYYLVDSNGIITTIYHGSFMPKCQADLSDLPYHDSNKATPSAVTTSMSAFSSSNLVCHPDYLFESKIYSQSAQRYITKCPEYFNDVPGYYNIACSAVSGARLVSFYDRYSSYDLVNGLLPLNQEDNESAVHNLVKELISERKTSPTEGTYLTNEKSGLQSYLNNHNGSTIKVNSGTGFSSYQDWILTSSNPVLLDFRRNDGKRGHTVLGIGFSIIRSGSTRQNYYMVNYNAADHSKQGDYIFNDSNYYMGRFLYLTK